ncbi:alpha/beta hydrolase [Tistrella mobilis]
MRSTPGHGEILSYYDFGRTTVQVCAADPRFSYCAYVPESYDEAGDRRYRLLVVVHGTMRDNAACRDAFIDLAEAQQLIVLAPLFPAGITAPRELSSYKRLRGPGDADARGAGPAYDLILLQMIREMQALYRIDAERFALFGFSGGGHFAHRFLYAHPERLAAVSIGAPGIVTLLDDQVDWPAGVRDVEAIFGRPIDLAAMRRVAVQMVVGAEDTATWEIAITRDNPWWQPAFERHGATRIERLAALKASFESRGIPVTHDLVPGTAHRQEPLLPVVKQFLSDRFAQGERDHRP